jgi:hypothetical protein
MRSRVASVSPRVLIAAFFWVHRLSAWAKESSMRRSASSTRIPFGRIGRSRRARTHGGSIGLALATLVAAVLAGCGGSSGGGSPSTTGSRLAPIKGHYSPSIDPADFGAPIDNPYLPLNPGTTFRYRGVGDDGKTPELNTVAVTHRTKRIMGIDAVVVLDQVFSAGRPEERTFDWYAQDKQGNVWYFGEDSSNYEHGRWVRDEGSWEAGLGSGKPGIIMLAHPKRGDAYRQEYSPGHAVDQARVVGSGGPVTVPYRSFARTLAIREYSSIDKQFERKYYARGVGVIKEQALTASKERSELVRVTR